jgi:hypothetical protein
MRVVFEMLCGIALALIVGNNAFAKEWRGIIPLHSTRADVEKLLGPPPNDEAALYQPSDNRSIHNLDLLLGQEQSSKRDTSWDAN